MKKSKFMCRISFIFAFIIFAIIFPLHFLYHLNLTNNSVEAAESLWVNNYGDVPSFNLKGITYISSEQQLAYSKCYSTIDMITD